MSTPGTSQIIHCGKCGAANRIDPTRRGAVCGRCHAPLGVPAVVTDASFGTEVERSTVPVLVDFWAAWCGPCRMVAPIVDELAAELSGKARVCKLDVDANQQTAARFRVQSIPTMIIFKDGREVDRLVGAQSKQAILQRLGPHMK